MATLLETVMNDEESLRLMVLLQPEQIAAIDEVREILSKERKAGKPLTRQDVVRAAVDMYTLRRTTPKKEAK